jgi:hypothetical protein
MRSLSILLLLLVLSLLLPRFAAAEEDGVDVFDEEDAASEGEFSITWREMIEAISNVTKILQQSMESTSRELDVVMQSWHARNLQLFEKMKQTSEQSNVAWKDAFERQAALFKTRVDSALKQVSSFAADDPKDRFILLHHTDEITLPRLYRILRAKEQVEALGHRYVLLHRFRGDDADGQEEEKRRRGLLVVQALMPQISSSSPLELGGGGRGDPSDVIGLVREWLRSSNSTAELEFEHIWAVSLDLDWLGSLPRALVQLGNGRTSTKPAFRYPSNFVGLGCVAGTNSTTDTFTTTTIANFSTAAATARQNEAGVAQVREWGRRLSKALRALFPLRLVRWFVGLLSGPARPLDPLSRPADFCFLDVWRSSRAFLLERNGGVCSSPTSCFNAARSAHMAQDATAYGLEYGLLSAHAFSLPQCPWGSPPVASETTCALAGPLGREEWSSAKDQFRLLRIKAKSGIVYAPPGVLFRNADRTDFELDI